MLKISDSLLTKLGNYNILTCNQSIIPVSIIPEHSQYANSTGIVIDELGDPKTLVSSSFTLSVEITQTSWASGATTLLAAWADVAGENGITFYQKADNHIEVKFLSATVATVTLDWDASGLTAGSHQITLVRKVGTYQKLYVDKTLVDSDTVAADTIGYTTVITATVSSIALTNPIEITTTGAHLFTSLDPVAISGIVGTMDLHGIDTLNGNSYTLTSTAANKFTIPIDGHLFDARTSGGMLVSTPSMVGYALTGWDKQVFTKNILDANDVAILYEIVRNNLITIKSDGTIEEVTKS